MKENGRMGTGCGNNRVPDKKARKFLSNKERLVSVLIAFFMLAGVIFANRSFSYLKSDIIGAPQEITAGVITLNVSFAQTNGGYEYIPGADLYAGAGLTVAINYYCSRECNLRLRLECTIERFTGEYDDEEEITEDDEAFTVKTTETENDISGDAASLEPDEDYFECDEYGNLDYIVTTQYGEGIIKGSGTITNVLMSLKLNGEKIDIDTRQIKFALKAYIKQADAPDWISAGAPWASTEFSL